MVTKLCPAASGTAREDAELDCVYQRAAQPVVGEWAQHQIFSTGRQHRPGCGGSAVQGSLHEAPAQPVAWVAAVSGCIHQGAALTWWGGVQCRLVTP